MVFYVQTMYRRVQIISCTKYMQSTYIYMYLIRAYTCQYVQDRAKKCVNQD